jgi:hypothetical protein
MLRCGRAGVNLGAPLLPKPFGRQPTSPASHRSGARWTCPSRGRSGRCYDGHSQQRPHGSSMHACMHAATTTAVWRLWSRNHCHSSGLDSSGAHRMARRGLL